MALNFIKRLSWIKKWQQSELKIRFNKQTKKIVGNISQTTENLKKFTMFSYVYIYAILQTFFQLSPTSTMLRHINHFMNLYISLEKREKSQYIYHSKRDLHII